MYAQINQPKIENIEVTRGLASLGVCVVHMGMLAEYNSFPAVNYIVNSGQLLCFHCGKFAGWADRRFILAYGHFFALGFLAFLVKVKKIPPNFGIGLLILLCLEMAF